MKVSYINEGVAIMWPADMEDRTPFNINLIVSDMLAMRTKKDLVDFLLRTPPSFFARMATVSRVDYVMIRDLESNEPGKLLKGSIADVIERGYPEIEYLDSFVGRSGDLGPYDPDYLLDTRKDGSELHIEAVHPTKPYHDLTVSLIEELASNLQAIAKLGAIASGDAPTSCLNRVELHCDVPVKVFDSGLSIYSEFNKMPAQNPEPNSYFSRKEFEAIKKALEKIGIENGIEHVYFGEGLASLFLYPDDVSDQEAAANMYLSFMNSLFEGDAIGFYSGNVFEVERVEGGFAVKDKPAAIRDMYRECASLVANHAIRLCAHCGKPLLADKSRGNEAMYCSRSCNTKASIARRDTAYAMAATGAPVEEAIEKIGQRYETSIRRWYQESHDLLK